MSAWSNRLFGEATVPTVLWFGLVGITLTLTFLLWTRWGRYRLVRKCLILSLLAHVLFALYSSTVNVVVAFSATPAEPPTPIRVERIDLSEKPVTKDAPPDRPAPVWDRSETRAPIESPRTLEQPAETPAQDPERTEPAPPPLPEMLPDPEMERKPAEMPAPELRASPVDVAAASAEKFAPEPGKARKADAPNEPQPAARSLPVAPDLAASDLDRSVTPQAVPDIRSALPAGRISPSDAPRRRVPIVDVIGPAGPERAGADLALRPEVNRKSEQAPAAALTARGAPTGLPAAFQSSGAPELDRMVARPGRSAESAVAVPTGLPQPPSIAGGSATVRPRTHVAVGGASRAGSSLSPGATVAGGTPVAGLPKLLTPGRTPGGSRDLDTIPVLYGNRSAPHRAEIATSRGGSAQSEQAVDRALAWLAAHQSPDGRWDGDGFTAACPPGQPCLGQASLAGAEDCAMTGLALLCFLGAGHTWQEGKYTRTVATGLNWLLSQQGTDGDVRGEGRMYSHGIATLALCEAYGMTGDSRLRAPVERAVRFIVAAQNRNTGGWRYQPGEPISDMSVTGWQIMALKSASVAGIEVPEATWARVRHWLSRVSAGAEGGLASYLAPGTGESTPTPTMTAQAMLCREFLGAGPTDPAVREAAEYLMNYLPSWSRVNVYYWYYGALATYQMGGPYWERWNAAMRDTLVEHQRRDGHAAGSWDPVRSVPWDTVGGRVYTTALSTLCLESYYRFLPFRELNRPAGAKAAAPAVKPTARPAGDG
jgi:hypothetical protein